MKFGVKPLKELFNEVDNKVEIERYFVETKGEAQKITYHITTNYYAFPSENLKIGKIIEKVRPIDPDSYNSGKEENIIIKLKNLPENETGHSTARIRAKIHYSDFEDKKIISEDYSYWQGLWAKDDSGLVRKLFDIRKFLN